MPSAKRRAAAFTIVELLVVIAIIGMLIALLLPAVQQARESGRRSQCGNNLKQIGVAYGCFESSYQSLPPAYISDPTKPVGWGIFILPYLELKVGLYDYYNFKTPFYYSNPSATIDNQRIANTQIPYFMCPSAPIRGPYDYTFSYPGYPSITWQASPADYNPVARVDSGMNTLLSLGYTDEQLKTKFKGALEPDKKMPVNSISDGTSHTILVAEIAAKNDLWINGQNTRRKVSTSDDPLKRLAGQGGWADATSAATVFSGSISDGSDIPGDFGINVSNDFGLYSFHHGLVNVLMADGSVQSLLEETDIRALVGMITRAGGEIENNP